MKNKVVLLVVLFGLTVGFSGCLPNKQTTVEDPALKLQQDAGLTEEQVQNQELSDQDDVETLELEAQGTVFLDEEFADLE